MVLLYITPFTDPFLYITLTCILKIWCVEMTTQNITISDAWVLLTFYQVCIYHYRHNGCYTFKMYLYQDKIVK